MQHTLEQSLPCWRDTQPDTRGTLCSLHSDEAGRLFALTAGHVLKSAPGIGIVGGPWGGAGVGISGAIAPNATDFVDNGRYFDVGVIGVNSLDPGVASLPPWNQLRQLITSAGLSKVIYKTNGQPSSGRVYGADGTVAVMFDGIYRDDFLWNSRLYAAPLIGYRDNTGTLRGGFSGSAVTDASGTQLLGLHILGEEGPNALGFAQSVSLLQYQVASRMNCTLSLAGR